MLRERKFCSEAHREEHHRLLLACLRGDDAEGATPKRKQAPAAAGFVAETVLPASAIAQSLPGSGWPSICVIVYELAVGGRGSPLAPSAPPAAALIPIPTTQLEGRREPVPAPEIPHASRALPLRPTHGGAGVFRHGLLSAPAACLAPNAVESAAEPAATGSAWRFGPAEPLYKNAGGRRLQVKDQPPPTGLIVFEVDSLTGPVVPVRSGPVVLGAIKRFPRLRLAPGGKAWRGANALRVDLHEARQILPVRLSLAIGGAPQRFRTAPPVLQCASGHSRRAIVPPQSLCDTPPLSGLMALAVDSLAGSAAPLRHTPPLAIGTMQLLPRLQRAPIGKSWDGAAALPVGLSLVPQCLPAEEPLAPAGAARAFSEPAFRIPDHQPGLEASSVLLCRGPLTYGLSRDPEPSVQAPVVFLEMHAWALASAPSWSALAPARIPIRRAPPELAKLRAPALPAQYSPEPLSSDQDWRVRLVVRRPGWEAWKSPIPPEPPAEEYHEPPPATTLLSRLWALVPNCRFVITPARAAILAIPLIGIGVALSALTKPAVHPARVERTAFFETVRTFLRERSAILIEDDFSSGISGWDGGPEWANGWAYGTAGFVQPRKLALLKASLPLADYRLEFLGQIENQSLSWVFRATDLLNYYATKITIARPGPLPLGAIVRYTVVDGVAVDRVQLPLPIGIRNDTLYRVETSANQDRFTTSINGHVVDTFFDRRHPSGGVGLFSGPGESSRVLWVHVAERDDLLGRLCAYFSSEAVDSKTAFLPIAKKKKVTAEQ